MTVAVTNQVSMDQIKALELIANYAHTSKQFAKLGGKEGIFCIAMFAQELGLNPMTCLFGGMRAVLGNIEISPRMMNAMIRKAGHSLEIIESTDKVCKIKGKRHDTKEEHLAIFTIDDANRAGLVRAGSGWEKFPCDMLFARCISRLARRLFPDVISTAYVEGEIDHPETVVEKREIEAQIIQVNGTVEAPKSEPEPTITIEQAQEIENMIHLEDKQYRTDLLGYFSNRGKINPPLADFYRLPVKHFDACVKSVNRRAETLARGLDVVKKPEKMVEGVLIIPEECPI